MPELPEVETVRRALELHLGGRQVCAVGGRAVRLRRPLELDHLARQLEGLRFGSPRRRGKHLLIDMYSEEGRGERLQGEPLGALHIHLGMTGRLLLVEAQEPEPRHTHLTLVLDSGQLLRYVDARRFGMVEWLAPEEEAGDPSLSALGIEPLDPRLAQALPSAVRRRTAPIKSLLLDQHLVAGVGNIYANEALWRSEIAPHRSGSRISRQRLVVLAERLQEVLREAIAAGGTTLRDFASLDAEAGYFAIDLSVYDRQGQPCESCGSPISRSTIGGRSTFWCRACQR